MVSFRYGFLHSRYLKQIQIQIGKWRENILLLGEQVTIYVQVKISHSNIQIHYKKNQNEDYMKNPKFDLQLTFGQLLTFDQTIDQVLTRVWPNPTSNLRPISKTSPSSLLHI